MYIFYPFSGLRIIGRIMNDPDVEKFPELKLFNPDIFIPNISDCIIVSWIDSHTSPIVALRLVMLQNVNILKHDILNDISTSLGIPMGSYIHRMGDIRPED